MAMAQGAFCVPRPEDSRKSFFTPSFRLVHGRCATNAKAIIRHGFTQINTDEIIATESTEDTENISIKNYFLGVERVAFSVQRISVSVNNR